MMWSCTEMPSESRDLDDLFRHPDATKHDGPHLRGLAILARARHSADAPRIFRDGSALTLPISVSCRLTGRARHCRASALLSESLLSHPLLTAPIGRSLLRLAGPTTGLMVVQIFVAVAETWFIARLGADALAGFALVLPFLVLMHNTANGGMGGGVSSALARALGGERLEDARALVLHALVLAAAFGLVFAILAWTIAPSLYRLMGGSGLALERALAFSDVVFGGAVVVWTSAFLAALMRGAGDAVTPGRYGLLMSIAYVPLAGVLTLGIRRLVGPRHGGAWARRHRDHGWIGSLAGACRVAWQVGHRPAAGWCEAATPPVRRDPARRRHGLLHDAGREPRRAADDRPGRPLRHRRLGGLRRRPAARIHGGAACLRHRHGAHDDGRRGGRCRGLEARAYGSRGLAGSWPSSRSA